MLEMHFPPQFRVSKEADCVSLKPFLLQPLFYVLNEANNNLLI
jgi:hypothetical protein